MTAQAKTPKPTQKHLDVKKPRAKKPRVVKTAPPLPEVAPETSRIRGLRQWLYRHISLFTLLFGSTAVTIWTVLRTISNGVNFDVVGQVGVAQQWSDGLRGGVQLGSTNYVLKMPIYWLVNHISVLTPHARLFALALGFNLITFWLLFMLMHRLRKLFLVEDKLWLSLALIWLTTIAGNVFWMDYANSRNLEVVGGLYVLYLAMKLSRQWRRRTLVLLFVVAAIVFFADPLQWYVCGASIILYALGRLIRAHEKPDVRYSVSLIGVILAAVVGAKGLQMLLKHLLRVSFLPAPTTPNVLSNLGAVMHAVATSTLEIFDADFVHGTLGVNTGRQILDGVVAVGVLTLLIGLLMRMRLTRSYGIWLLVTGIGVNYLVYMAGGEALIPDTHRYLIMVPLLLIMMIAASGDRLQTARSRRRLGLGWAVLSVIAVVMLAGAVVINWPTRFSKDAHIRAMISFMDSQHFDYALAPRETGITTTYFSRDRLHVLPMGCATDHLMPTNLFYDSAAFEGVEHYPGEVPILLQSNAISFGNTVCTRTAIIEEFGIPQREVPIPGYGTALVYRHISLKPRHSPIDRRQVVALQSKPAAATLPTLGDCKTGAINVVIAHPDDDLLFMNPSLAKQMAVHCVRTVYVTAADDGRDSNYWMGRQRGIEAAYAEMANADNIWTDTTALIDKHTVLVGTLASRPSVSLVFLRLPDGNVHGEGFPSTGNVSLEKLSKGPASEELRTIDGQESYSYKELTQVITAVLLQDKPALIYTHTSGTALSQGDHSDHQAVGILTLRARILAQSTAQVDTFVGYPMNYLVRNLDEAESAQKRQIFNTYASHDGVICKDGESCSIELTYGRYLERMYVIVQRQAKVSRSQQSSDSYRKPGPKTSAAPSPLAEAHDVLQLFRL